MHHATTSPWDHLALGPENKDEITNVPASRSARKNVDGVGLATPLEPDSGASEGKFYRSLLIKLQESASHVGGAGEHARCYLDHLLGHKTRLADAGEEEIYWG